MVEACRFKDELNSMAKVSLGRCLTSLREVTKPPPLETLLLQIPLIFIETFQKSTQ